MALSLQLRERKNVLLAVDLILVNVATFAAFWLHARLSSLNLDLVSLSERWGLFLLLSTLWLVSLFANDLYNLSKTSNFVSGARAIAMAVMLVVVAYMTIFFFFASPQRLPMRRVVLYQCAIAFGLIGSWRLLCGFLIRYPAFSRKVIIVGAGWAGKTIAEAIYRHINPHYQILGFVDDDPAKLGQMIVLNGEGLKASGRGAGDIRLTVLGASKDLKRIVKEHDVPEIVLAITHDLQGELVEALLDCQSLGVQITLMPVLYERITGRVPVQHIGNNWYVALPLDHPAVSGIYPILKRALDVVGALVGLILYAPLLPFLALAICLDSPGPIFYIQKRVGRGGKVFRAIKLRTMVPEMGKSGSGLILTSKRDPRITRVGRILRKMHLDEFPQLINILKGDMSAVGPRAMPWEEFKRVQKEIPLYRLRNAVRPGMAGWAQVNYDYVASVEDARIRLEYDLYYIKHQSLWLDILIILKMIGKMLTLRGR